MSIKLVDLPRSWSPKDRLEKLTPAAAASLSRVLMRAVAETGVNFQLNDAYRSKDEQIALFKANYSDTGRKYKAQSTDRWYAGTVWRRKPGSVAVASPDLYGTGTGANHTKGEAVDVAPGPIQSYLQRKGLASGWSWDEGKRNGEPWHFVYIESKDQYRHEGFLDHAAVQKAVGAEVDGKIGTGTVEKIKAKQRELGLTVDGKVGAETKRALGLSGKDEAAPAPSVPATPSGGASVPAPGPALEPDAVLTPSKSGGFVYTYTREQWDTQGVAEDVHPYDAPVKGIYLHWPGSSDSFKGKSPEEIATVLRGYRRDHVVGNGWRDIGYGAAVDSEGRTYELRGLDMEVGSNGGDQSNSEAGSILFLLGTRETPTPEMIAGANGLLAQYADAYGKGYLRGHRQSPDASTTCPGARIMGLIEDGSLNWDGSAAKVIEGSPIKESGAGHVVVDGRLGTDSVSEIQRRLGVAADGRAAEDTWKALQLEVDAPYKDGQISRQSYRAEELGNGVVDRKSAWEYTGPGSEGSQTVELLQKRVGVKVDGVWFEGTTRALQRKLNADSSFLRR